MCRLTGVWTRDVVLLQCGVSLCSALCLLVDLYIIGVETSHTAMHAGRLVVCASKHCRHAAYIIITAIIHQACSYTVCTLSLTLKCSTQSFALPVVIIVNTICRYIIYTSVTGGDELITVLLALCSCLFCDISVYIRVATYGMQRCCTWGKVDLARWRLISLLSQVESGFWLSLLRTSLCATLSNT